MLGGTPTKRSRDVNEMARSIVDEATGDAPKIEPKGLREGPRSGRARA
jgi:hypothetical protein